MVIFKRWLGWLLTVTAGASARAGCVFFFAMVALCFLVDVSDKEKPPSSDAWRRTEGGRVVLCLAVKNASPFVIEIAVSAVGGMYTLQDLLEPAVDFSNTKSNRIAKTGSTADGLYDCSFSLATGARLGGR